MIDNTAGQAAQELDAGAGRGCLPGREAASPAPMHQPAGVRPQKTSPDDVDALTLRVATAKAVLRV